MKTIRYVLGVGLAATAIHANAQQGTATSISGQVSQVMILASASGAPGNYDFRVLLQGVPVQCNGQTWSYVNASDPNYKGIVAGILSAKAANATVSLYVIQDGAGYCQIGYIVY